MTDKKLRQPIDVVVCVHNSPDDVRHCLTTVRDTLVTGDRLIIVDDGSDDETRLLCKEVAASASDRIDLIRRSEGSGFCKAANAGMRETTADMVVVLNSDTIVVADWLDRMAACMNANWQIGIVGPLSNAGGWQSIPDLPSGARQCNAMANDLSTLSSAHLYCSRYAEQFDYPFVEQINGFCIGLSRAVLDTVGLFDEDAFPMGYGEENDLTFRAMDAGFLCAVAIDCFVFHAKTKSYTPEIREKYNASGQVKLHARHGKGRVMKAVTSTQEHPVLVAIREDAKRAFATHGWQDPASQDARASAADDDVPDPIEGDASEPKPRQSPAWSSGRLSYDDA